jgi:hypothetical protein
MKLNQREQTIIKAMQDGEKCVYMPYAGRFNPNAYYDIGAIGKCTREITKLIKLGLVEHETSGFNTANIFLTQAGEDFKVELEEPYDVWVIDRGWELKVNKYSGFLKNDTLLMANGSSVKKGKDREFFTDRDKAFEYAIALQERAIRIAEGKVGHEKKALENLEKQRENPEEDEAGYL